MSIRLLQLQNDKGSRRVALVREPRLELLKFDSVYELATLAARNTERLQHLMDRSLAGTSLEYDPVYNGQSEWRILPPLDHPAEPARLHVSGTGLTHLGSASSRNAMHKPEIENQKSKIENPPPETDSMKMFRWGVEGGKPAPGAVGIAPEWFYKGDGTILRAHHDPLDVPPFAEDGGEEAEIVGLYIIAADGTPIRVGMAQGNEFSDHVFEKKSYLNLAGSKLRACSVGPELVINPEFTSVPGNARITRVTRASSPHPVEEIIWAKSLISGEDEMSHSLANLEHHHFKFPGHRRPGDVHVHFFGACALSCADGIRLQEGDVMQIHFEGFGRPLHNPLRFAADRDQLIIVNPLT